jgi:hypothetical protein
MTNVCVPKNDPGANKFVSNIKRECGCVMLFVTNVDPKIKYRQEPNEMVFGDYPCEKHRNDKDWKVLHVHEVIENTKELEKRVIKK